MSKYTYFVGKDEYINRVESTGDKKTLYYKEPRAFEITQFDIASPLYPCREDFIKESLIDSKEKETSFDDVYYPIDLNRVEYSNFIHYPTHLETSTRVFIEVEEDTTCEFEVVVTGGIKIWLNDKVDFIFKPYVRNTGTKTNHTFNFKKGINELVVYFDDIAERDVIYFYELKNLSNTILKCSIDIEEDVSLVEKANNVLKGFYLDDDYFEDGDIYLNFDGECDNQFNIKYNLFGVKGSFEIEPFSVGIDGEIDVKKKNRWKIYTIKETYNSMNEVMNGSGYLLLEIMIGKIKVQSKLFCAIYSRKFFEKYNNNIPETLNERKKLILDIYSKSNARSVSVIMSYLEINNKYDESLTPILNWILDRVNSRPDCADFHVSSLVLMYKRYSNLLPEELREKVKECILNFRYCWDEVGNDCMCFYSENHQMCFYSAQYLAGSLFKDELFSASNRLGKEQKEIGRRRVNKWLDSFNKDGFSEYFSSTYIPVDLKSFIPLFELAEDEDVKEKVTKALENLFKSIGYSLYNGLMITTHGRTYEKEMKADKTLGMASICYVAFGVGVLNPNLDFASLVALSSYEVNNYVKEFELKDNEYFLLNAIQGFNIANTYQYRTNYYSLDSTIKYKVGVCKYGSTECLMNCAMGSGINTTRIWINHPGENQVSGEGRPSYWAGQGVFPHVAQYKNLCMGIFKTNGYFMEMIHAYFPENRISEYKIDGNFAYLRVDDSYLAIYMSDKLKKTERKSILRREIYVKGNDIKTFMYASSKVESHSFDEFMNYVKSFNVYFDQNSLTVKIVNNEFKLEYNDNLYLNGEVVKYRDNVELIPEKGLI